MISIAISAACAACVPTPTSGTTGDELPLGPRIVGVDTARSPGAATIQLDQSAYVALLLIAPGHSATLLYPDSTTNNQLSAGVHRLSFTIPGPLVRIDTVRPRLGSGRVQSRIQPGLSAIPPETPTYLLLLASPQELSYERLFEKTAGVSIPLLEDEALNAMTKAVKSTLPSEPRPLAGHYQLIELFRIR